MGRGCNGLLKIAALALVAGLPTAASAQALILRSLGPSAGRYPPGSRTPPGATFNLRPGDSVSILAGGATRTFRGPGVFTATGPAAAGGVVTARINTGAVRGPGDTGPVRTRSDIWQYDVTRSGRACVLAGRPLTLWRPSAERAVQLTITPQAGQARTVAWAAGADTLVWPADLPVTAGASYQLSWSGDVAPTRLTARPIAGVGAADLDALAAAFTSNRCDGQLDVLIALHDAEAARAAAPPVSPRR